jgi:hypothetical protein
MPQISTMAGGLPDRLHAFWYPLISIASALLLGIAVYGAPAWARM